LKSFFVNILTLYSKAAVAKPEAAPDPANPGKQQYQQQIHEKIQFSIPFMSGA